MAPTNAVPGLLKQNGGDGNRKAPRLILFMNYLVRTGQNSLLYRMNWTPVCKKII